MTNATTRNLAQVFLSACALVLPNPASGKCDIEGKWDWNSVEPQLVGASADGQAFVIRWVHPCEPGEGCSPTCAYPPVEGKPHDGVMLALSRSGTTDRTQWIIYRGKFERRGSNGEDCGCTRHDDAGKQLAAAKAETQKLNVRLDAKGRLLALSNEWTFEIPMEALAKHGLDRAVKVRWRIDSSCPGKATLVADVPSGALALADFPWRSCSGGASQPTHVILSEDSQLLVTIFHASLLGFPFEQVGIPVGAIAQNFKAGGIPRGKVAPPENSATPAPEGANKVDSFVGWGGVELGQAFTKRQDFKKKWEKATEEGSALFFAQRRPHVRVFKVPVDGLVVAVSKRLKRVFLLTAKVTDDASCDALQKTLMDRFGEPFKIGKEWLQWEGEVVDLTYRKEAPDFCTLNILDRRYDDHLDRYKKRD